MCVYDSYCMVYAATVPQASVFDPVLYLVYTNYLPVLHAFILLLYADDVNFL